MTFWEDQAQQAMQGLQNGEAFAIFAAIQANTEQQERIATTLEQLVELLGHITIKYVDGRVKTDEPSLDDMLDAMAIETARETAEHG